MKTKNSTEKFLVDINSNLKKLEDILIDYISSLDNRVREELILKASFLIEKIIFYTQLQKGVDVVATYTYNDRNIKESLNSITPFNFNEKGYDMEKLFLIREYIVREYKKYKKIK